MDKPWYMRTEFWMSVGSTILPAIVPGTVDPNLYTGAVAGVAAIYTLGRSLVEAFRK